MNESLVYLAGIGSTAIIFAFIIYQIREEHQLFKYIMIFGLIVLSMFIPTIMFNATINCENVVANSTLTNNNLSVTYQYTQVCNTSTVQPPLSYFTVLNYMYYAVALYLMLWSIWKVAMELINAMRGKQFK